MFKRSTPFFVFLLLILVINGCVSIPPRVQLVAMDVDTGLMQVKASCTGGPNADHRPDHSADHIPDHIPVSSQADAVLDAEHISLLNWNVYKGQRDNWASDFSQLIKQHDILVLQEALLDKTLFRAIHMQFLNWSMNTAFYYDEVEAGVLTASKVRAVRSCGLRATEPLIQIPKTALLSEYRLSKGAQNLLVANIHGINFTLGTKAYEQQINALSQAIIDHKGPVVVAGDFNTWSDKRMAIVNRMAERLSLKAIPYKNHNRLLVFGNPLDHVFYKGLELIKEDSPSVTSSDHNPISVIFRVPSAQLASVKL